MRKEDSYDLIFILDPDPIFYYVPDPSPDQYSDTSVEYWCGKCSEKGSISSKSLHLYWGSSYAFKNVWDPKWFLLDPPQPKRQDLYLAKKFRIRTHTTCVPDPDLLWFRSAGSGSRRAKIAHQNIKFHVYNAGCFLLRAVSFSCRFDVLYWALGIRKLQFFFNYVFFFNFWS